MPWPSVGIGATGVMGVAVESLASPGTYHAPAKFFAILNETLAYATENVKRRSLRGIADIVGVVAGRTSIKGDITFELMEDVLPYFMYAMRMTVAVAGSGNLTYTATPVHGASPVNWSGRTLSFTVVRNGVVFGYVGCVVSSIEIEASDNGIVQCKASVVGLDEAVQTAPTVTWPTTVPYGPGAYTIQIPTSTTVYDMDKFTFSVNDAATAQWRLQTSRIPSYVSFGERSVSYKTERDFTSRTEYDTYYKTATAAAGLSVLLSKSSTNQITFTLPTPTPDEYDVGALSGQGTLIRSTMTYDGIYNTSSSAAYTLICQCQETVALPA